MCCGLNQGLVHATQCSTTELCLQLWVELACAQPLQTAPYQAWGGLKSKSKLWEEHDAFHNPTSEQRQRGQAERKA